MIFTYEEASSLFEISKESPSGLIWKNTRKIAGWSDKRVIKNKGWLVQYKDRTIGVHRIVYLLHNGSLDFSKPVDHIDGNALNNNPKSHT